MGLRAEPSFDLESAVSLNLPKLQISLPPFLSGFSVSLFTHAFLLTGGLWFAHQSQSSYSGPSEFEVVSVDSAFESGLQAVKKKASVIPPPVTSQVDEAVLKKKAQEIQKLDEGTSTVDSRGMAGQAAKSAGTEGDVWQRYGATVRQSILDQFRYPPASRSLGETGRVKVAFAVLTDGSIVDVSLKHPSAFARLNTAAVALVEKLARVGPLPDPNLPRWDTEIAIDFLLN